VGLGPFKRKFCKLLLGAAALSRTVTNALFASQLLQWNIKLLFMFINRINRCVWMHDRGLRRINIGIARHGYRAHGVSFRWAVRQCCHWTF